MSTRRRIGGAMLIIALIAVSIGALALADAGSPGQVQCYALLAALNPHWLGCALAVHEALGGSLIAASGALFVGWLAYVVLAEQAAATAEQVDMARADQRAARRLELARLVAETGRDLDLMRAAKGFVSAIAEKFPQEPGVGTTQSDAFSARLIDLRTGGYLRPSSRAVLAPDGNGQSIETVMNRLHDLANNIHEETKELSADIRAGILRRRNPEVALQAQALRELAVLLEGQIPRYQAKFDDAASQLEAFQNSIV